MLESPTYLIFTGMNRRILLLLLFFIPLFFSCRHSATPEKFYYASEEEFIRNNQGLSDTALIGKMIFFDKDLSEPAGVSCATCHSPMAAFSDPRHTPFSEGSLHQHGKRNAPAISYMAFAPNRRAEIVHGAVETVGGFFWDGKAEILNDQALFPLINTTEMNNPGFGVVAGKIRKAAYYPKLEKLFGKDLLKDSLTLVFYSVMCLQKFQVSEQVSPFTSKFDYYLEGKVHLSEQEMRGMKLFNDTTKAKCSLCHLSTPTRYASTQKILFTDYSYDNIGLPKNPALQNTPVDSGLGLFEPNRGNELGRFKTPTLRNVARTAPYMHSGIFSSLEEVLDFYNTRDVNPKFGQPEVPITMNKDMMGDLHLSKQDIQDIIAFLNTLNDGYRLNNKTP